MSQPATQRNPSDPPGPELGPEPSNEPTCTDIVAAIDPTPDRSGEGETRSEAASKIDTAARTDPHPMATPMATTLTAPRAYPSSHIAHVAPRSEAAPSAAPITKPIASSGTEIAAAAHVPHLAAPVATPSPDPVAPAPVVASATTTPIVAPPANPSGGTGGHTPSIPPAPSGDARVLNSVRQTAVGLGSNEGRTSVMPTPPLASANIPSYRPPSAVAMPSYWPRVDGMSPRNALRASREHVRRDRAYSFVLDSQGQPVEIGAGRFARAFLGEERWLESKTDYRRDVVIKVLQKGVSHEGYLRFQTEKELLERVQGHDNIVELLASGEGEDAVFLPESIRDRVEPDFMILERLETSLEDRLRGTRGQPREDLLRLSSRERLLRALEYLVPIARALEYAHIVKSVCHRDVKPGNVLITSPDPRLRGAQMSIRLADFNVAKAHGGETDYGLTQLRQSVPGTLFFQSPEQEHNVVELHVGLTQGSAEVDYFEDFYFPVGKTDGLCLFNRPEMYPIAAVDRARKKLVLARPFLEPTESTVRARVHRSVGRPADLYSLGALFYYLVTGAYGNPKALSDAFERFVAYQGPDLPNIAAYMRHEWAAVAQARATQGPTTPNPTPQDRFFTFRHLLDGNGELVDPNVMLVIAKCMIRNKPDSYCQASDLDTRGISEALHDLIGLEALYRTSATPRSNTIPPPKSGAFSTKAFGVMARWFGPKKLKA